MQARYPYLIKSMQYVERGSFSSSPTDDTIAAVASDRAIVIPLTLCRVSAGTDVESYFRVKLNSATALRWEWQNAAPNSTVGALVVEFHQAPLGISLVTTNTIGMSPGTGTTDVTISPPAGAAVNRTLVMPADWSVEYSGNWHYHTGYLLSSTSVRFRWYCAGTSFNRSFRSSVIWF